jgi:hypothetical protein
MNITLPSISSTQNQIPPKFPKKVPAFQDLIKAGEELHAAHGTSFIWKTATRHCPNSPDAQRTTWSNDTQAPVQDREAIIAQELAEIAASNARSPNAWKGWDVKGIVAGRAGMCKKD